VAGPAGRNLITRQEATKKSARQSSSAGQNDSAEANFNWANLMASLWGSWLLSVLNFIRWLMAYLKHELQFFIIDPKSMTQLNNQDLDWKSYKILKIFFILTINKSNINNENDNNVII